MLHLTELLRSLPTVYVRSTNHVVQTYSLLRMTLLNCSSEEQILLLNQESTSIQGLREFISGYRWVEQLSAWRYWKAQSLGSEKVFFFSFSDLNQCFVQTKHTKYCGTQHTVSGQVTNFILYFIFAFVCQYNHLSWQATSNKLMQFITSLLEVQCSYIIHCSFLPANSER